MKPAEPRQPRPGRGLLAVAGLTVALVAVAGVPARASLSTSFPLRRVSTIALPGRPTRFDYQSLDSTSRRLYVAHLGDSTVDVVDLERDKVAATIGPLADVHGVLAVPALRRVYATATGDDQLATIDTTTTKVVWRSPSGAFPDGLAYDPDDNLVLVSDKSDGTETLIDATTGAHVATIPVAAEVGNVTYDLRTHLAYVAARTPEQLAIINLVNRHVVARLELHGCGGAHGVYLDPTAGLAYVACESNARLVTVDLSRRRQIARNTVGASPDVLAYDPALHRLYVAGESGVVTVFDTSGPVPRTLGRHHLADTAHSVAVDPGTHLVYFPLERGPNGRPTLAVYEPR